MAPAVQQIAQIFEDQDATKTRKLHRRVPSVGDVLRGRKKENSPTKPEMTRGYRQEEPSPLGERHINSPPRTTRVPLKTDASRPPMHKKTGSSVSLKSLILGKDKNISCENIAGVDNGNEKKPKKQKSSTNLGALLKKKSKRDLKDPLENQENVSPTKVSPEIRTPLWAEFATQPLSTPDGIITPGLSRNRTLEEEIKLYTPKDYSEYLPAEQRNFYGIDVSSNDFQPPQRPFLQHKSSRSSIFTEELDEEENTPELKRPKSRSQSPEKVGSPSRPERVTKDERGVLEDSKSNQTPKRASKVLSAISTLNFRGCADVTPLPQDISTPQEAMSPQELDQAFEKVLDSLNVPQNMRDNMRSLKPDVKAGLMKGGRSGSGSSTGSNPQSAQDVRSSARNLQKRENEKGSPVETDPKENKRARSRSRPRSRILTISKRDDRSPSKQEKESTGRSRSKSRTRSVEGTTSRPLSSASMGSTVSINSMKGHDSSTTPGDFIHYLREVQKPELVEVGRIHKLRLLLRNEAISWTDHFVTKGGMDELVQLLYRTIKIEWREEHEDNLLHETLLCLKALCTTELALQRLHQIEQEFFPILLAMLFDPERKGPSEFTTRGVIISLLFTHLSAALPKGQQELENRSKTILQFLRDPSPEQGKEPLDFVSQMHTSRPYRLWCKEVVNVTKEVFWIFLHHLTVVPVIETEDTQSTFTKAHFPAPRAPQPAAPYVGGVEWEATQYMALHLDLINGLIASFPNIEQRNQLREDLKQSGWEKVMGGSLRTCKEKFYSGVHDGLKVWVSAAKSDKWPVEEVRSGPPRESCSPKKSPMKKKGDEAPQLSLDVGLDSNKMDDAWV